MGEGCMAGDKVLGEWVKGLYFILGRDSEVVW